MKKQAKEFYTKITERCDQAEARLAKRLPLPASITKIHITGMCGKGTASLAGLLIQSGYEVSGSDAVCFSPMKDIVDELEAEFSIGFDPKNLASADVVVIANACPPDNVEAVAARTLGKSYISMSEAIRDLVIKNKKALVVTGTHGKTTTTGLLAHILQEIESSPAFLIGGSPINGKPYSAGNESSRFFAVEGDEYDTAYFDKSPKFLNCAVHGGIITSIEHDHHTIYPTFNDYLQAFIFFAQEIPKDGVLVYSVDANDYKKVIKQAQCAVLSYGTSTEADLIISDIQSGDNGQTFKLSLRGKDLGHFSTSLSGKYNIENIASVVGLFDHYGIEADVLRPLIASYKGMKQRQEVLVDKKGVILIDDFAHHPTAVEKTIQGLRIKYPRKSLVVVFEPRSSTSRRKEFESDYIKALGFADFSYIATPELRENDDPNNFIDVYKIASSLKQSWAFIDHEEMIEHLIKNTPKEAVIAVMSNASFGNVRQELTKWVQNL